jgi:calcineurin-like phosphoesterase family protein
MKPNEFVTADYHFGHRAMLRYEPRPWSSVEEMNQGLIDRWNAKISKTSVVYHLGDFSFCNVNRTLEILDQLNGIIRLVLGNHEGHKKPLSKRLLERFDWVRNYYESKTEDGIKVVMFHYPILSWNKAHYGSWHLHGHSHGNLFDEGTRRLDVGINTHPDYEPYSFSEIASKMEGRSFNPVDHHQSLTVDHHQSLIHKEKP